jgi:hypothetical protein
MPVHGVAGTVGIFRADAGGSWLRDERGSCMGWSILRGPVHEILNIRLRPDLRESGIQRDSEGNKGEQR